MVVYSTAPYLKESEFLKRTGEDSLRNKGILNDKNRIKSQILPRTVRMRRYIIGYLFQITCRQGVLEIRQCFTEKLNNRYGYNRAFTRILHEVYLIKGSRTAFILARFFRTMMRFVAFGTTIGAACLLCSATCATIVDNRNSGPCIHNRQGQ